MECLTLTAAIRLHSSVPEEICVVKDSLCFEEFVPGADSTGRSVFREMGTVGWEFSQLILLFPSFRIFDLTSSLRQNPHNLFQRAYYKHYVWTW